MKTNLFYFISNNISNSWLDYTTLVIDIVGLAAIVFGVYYAASQISTNSKIHKEILEWNRKTYTEELLLNKYSTVKKKKLEEVFKTANSFKPVSLNQIEVAIEADVDVKHYLNDYLNRCEVVSRGIYFKILDEEIIKESMGFHLVKIYNNYKEYIDDTPIYVPKGYDKFDELIDKWKKNHYYDLMMNYSGMEK